jgi:hypothetical protein
MSQKSKPIHSNLSWSDSLKHNLDSLIGLIYASDLLPCEAYNSVSIFLSMDLVGFRYLDTIISTDIESFKLGIIFHLVIEKAFPTLVIKTRIDWIIIKSYMKRWSKLTDQRIPLRESMQIQESRDYWRHQGLEGCSN